MISYYNLEFPRPLQPTAVAAGFFDGLHLGHQKVIASAAAEKQSGLLPAVFTFTMYKAHPARKSPDGYALITPEEKDRQLESMGIMVQLCPDFADFCTFTPEEFVDEILWARLNAKKVFCGSDYRFGQKAAGNVDTLAVLCAKRHIEVQVMPPVLCHGERISSTHIRELLRAGEVEEAAQWLGRPFSFDFPVQTGKRLGRRLGFPTINQALPPEYVAVAKGVYASEVLVEGQWQLAMTNVGVRPTVEQTTALCSETFIPHYDGDLYGKRVKVHLLRFIRPERRFESVEALQAQITQDVAQIEAMGLERSRSDNRSM